MMSQITSSYFVNISILLNVLAELRSAYELGVPVDDSACSVAAQFNSSDQPCCIKSLSFWLSICLLTVGSSRLCSRSFSCTCLKTRGIQHFLISQIDPTTREILTIKSRGQIHVTTCVVVVIPQCASPVLWSFR